MFDQNPDNMPMQPDEVVFEFLDKDVILERSTDTADRKWVGFHVQSDAGNADIHVEVSLLAALVSASGHAETPKRWSGSTRSMVLIHLCRPLLGPLGNTFSTTLTTQITKVPPHKDALMFQLRSPHLGIGQLRVSGDVAMREKGLSVFEAALSKQNPETPNTQAACASLFSPMFEIETATLEQVAEGDVLLLDPDCSLFETCTVCFDDGREAQVSRMDGAYMLVSDPEKPEAPSAEDAKSTDSVTQFRAEIETCKFPNEDIAELDVGAALPFQAGSSAWVRILIGAGEFGTGQLVEIDGQTHVRLQKVN